MRVTRIRDPTGVVWYVRNGEILRVANQSQGWTMAAAVIPVSYNADLEEIRQVVIEVGNDMYNDPETRERMLGRPTFAGVEAVSGEAIYVRIVVNARASQQVPLTRELRERLKGAFDAHGAVVPVLTRPMGFNADGTPMTPGSVPPCAAERRGRRTSSCHLPRLAQPSGFGACSTRWGVVVSPARSSPQPSSSRSRRNARGSTIRSG